MVYGYVISKNRHPKRHVFTRDWSMCSNFSYILDSVVNKIEGILGLHLQDSHTRTFDDHTLIKGGPIFAGASN